MNLRPSGPTPSSSRSLFPRLSRQTLCQVSRPRDLASYRPNLYPADAAGQLLLPLVTSTLAYTLTGSEWVTGIATFGVVLIARAFTVTDGRREEEERKRDLQVVRLIEVNAAGKIVKLKAYGRGKLRQAEKQGTQAGDSLALVIYKILHPGSTDAIRHKLYLADFKGSLWTESDKSRADVKVGEFMANMDPWFVAEVSLGLGAAEAICSEFDVFVIKEPDQPQP